MKKIRWSLSISTTTLIPLALLQHKQLWPRTEWCGSPAGMTMSGDFQTACWTQAAQLDFWCNLPRCLWPVDNATWRKKIIVLLTENNLVGWSLRGRFHHSLDSIRLFQQLRLESYRFCIIFRCISNHEHESFCIYIGIWILNLRQSKETCLNKA